MSDYLPPPSPPPLVPGPPGPQSSTPTTALVLGILSIALSGVPFVGLALGIIGLNKSKAGAVELRTGASPPSATGMVTAGKVCSIIGTCLSGAVMVFWCLYATCIGSVILGGTAASGAAGSNGSPSGYRSR